MASRPPRTRRHERHRHWRHHGSGCLPSTLSPPLPCSTSVAVSRRRSGVLTATRSKPTGWPATLSNPSLSTSPPTLPASAADGAGGLFARPPGSLRVPLRRHSIRYSVVTLAPLLLAPFYLGAEWITVTAATGSVSDRRRRRSRIAIDRPSCASRRAFGQRNGPVPARTGRTVAEPIAHSRGRFGKEGDGRRNGAVDRTVYANAVAGDG